jgi:hypothetical protein
MWEAADEHECAKAQAHQPVCDWTIVGFAHKLHVVTPTMIVRPFLLILTCAGL